MSDGLGAQSGYLSLFSQHRLGNLQHANSAAQTSFSGVAVVARLVEGGDQPGALSQALATGGGTSLQGALTALPAAQRDSLQRQLGPQALQELSAISQERDPEMFYEALLAFGVRQEQADRLDWATRSYSLVAGAGHLQDLQRRAQGRLQAVMGQGAMGARAEFLLRRLSREACEPSSLLAMGAAGALFKVTRLAALSRLAATPTENFLTRGFGARALASTIAFAVEAPAFTMTGRLANEAMGHSQDWSLHGLSRDF